MLLIHILEEQDFTLLLEYLILSNDVLIIFVS